MNNDMARAARPGIPLHAGVALALLAGLVACGGGGGGGGGAAAPSPAATSEPPAYSGPRLTLAQLPASCASSPCTAGLASVTVDATGEASFFWTEAVPGAMPRLRAANHLAGTPGLAGSADIASNYNTATIAPRFAARPIAPRRFVVWQSDDPAPAAPSPNSVALHARIVDFAASAAPSATGPTSVPESLRLSTAGTHPFPGVVRDNAGALYAFANDPAAGTVVPLGGGTSLTVVPNPVSPFATTEAWALVEYPESIAPRAMWAVRGRSAGGFRDMVLADVSLPSGTLLPPVTISQQHFVVDASPVTCARVPPMRVRASVSALTQQVVAWTQLNGNGTGCDLMVNGTKVSGARNVSQYEVSVSGSEIVAVWEEYGSGGSNIYWSRRPLAPVGPWTAPAQLEPGFVGNGDIQTLEVMSAGPNATLLIVWRNYQPLAGGGFGNSGTWRVSKYAAGSWSTVGFSAPEISLRALAINAAGQGALVFSVWSCNGGSSNCEELAAYRF